MNSTDRTVFLERENRWLKTIACVASTGVALLFLTGATNDATTLEVKSLAIKNDHGQTVAELFSSGGTGHLKFFHPDGTDAIVLGLHPETKTPGFMLAEKGEDGVGIGLGFSEMGKGVGVFQKPEKVLAAMGLNQAGKPSFSTLDEDGRWKTIGNPSE